MSDDDWNIALPAFNVDNTLLTLKRFARDQALTERSEGWLLAGNLVMKLAVGDGTVTAQLAKRPSRTPEWDAFTLKSAADASKLQDEIKRRLLRWKDDR